MIKIGDYGMVKFFENGVMTTTTKLGTEEYMAPELFEEDGAAYDGAAVDVYALGVILYVIHTARMPFENCTKDWFYPKF